MTYDSNDLIVSSADRPTGTVAWQSPSNIALVKYWGKRPVQIPTNPSISLTLRDALTETSITYQLRQKDQEWINFKFEGKEATAFADRIGRFLTSLSSIFPFLQQLHLEIESSNTFPHSTGIASSASSMSALALCLCSIERDLFGTLTDHTAFYQKASYIARLGSGSASRSVYGGAAVWGSSPAVIGSHDEYAIPYSDQLHKQYQQMHDDVVIVSSAQKSVSSTAGHALMDTNPFAPTRYQQANDNLQELIKTLQNGDLDRWGQIVEEEAMTLHALMMCSRPSYMLMKPGTIACIDAIRAYREASGVPIYFTLDAGPNVHVLYPHTHANDARAFIQNELIPLSESGEVLYDQVGEGPKQLKG